jgi:hypothetical protein
MINHIFGQEEEDLKDSKYRGNLVRLYHGIRLRRWINKEWDYMSEAL